MGLSEAVVQPAIAVSDMDRAVEFYEGKLGFSGAETEPDGGRTYPCGGGTALHVFPSPHAGGSGATIAGFSVADLEAEVEELRSRGVTFEQYEAPVATDDRGIATGPSGEKAAWLKDPDGNVLALVGA
jgi:catechol 2,3-dioxygenase-like lactoylglutathione lyase family enzyme